MIYETQLNAILNTEFQNKDMPYCGMSDVCNFIVKAVKTAMIEEGYNESDFTWDFSGFTGWVMYKGSKIIRIDVKRKKAGHKPGVYGFNSGIRWVYSDFKVSFVDGMGAEIADLAEHLRKVNEADAECKRLEQEADMRAKAAFKLVMKELSLTEEEALATFKRLTNRYFMLFKK